MFQAGGPAASPEAFTAGRTLNQKLVAGFAGAVGVVIAGFAAEITVS
jgi:vacuolar-type H+-ATPase catalytic subunit A/Vma1